MESGEEPSGGMGATVAPYPPASPPTTSPSPQPFYNSSSLGVTGASPSPRSYSPTSPLGVNIKGRRHSWGSGNAPRSPQGLAGGAGGEGFGGRGEGGGMGGVWQVLWRSGGAQQQLLFEATQET
jgi:hypothetical protein